MTISKALAGTGAATWASPALRKRSILGAITSAIVLCACGGAKSGDAATPTGAAPGASVPVPGGGAQTQELRTTQPLMDGWRFVQNDDLSDADALASTGAGWQTVSLPHSWNAQDAANLQAGDYKRGLGWYRLEFATPTAGARHWLEFGAASLVADVWLNGQKLGQHRGGFTQFRFDVTDALAKGSAVNVLLVKVDNRSPDPGGVTEIDPLGGDYNKSGGLYRHVALISTNAAHFDLADLGGPGVYATTSAISGNTATVSVRARLHGDAGAAGQYTVRVSLVDAAGQSAATAEHGLQLGAGQDTEVTQDLSVPNAHLWQGVDDPYLYQLVAELLDGTGTPVDRVVQRFGIRQMRFDPNEGFFLNGRHVRLRGVAMHQDFLGKAVAVSDEDIDTSLGLVREIGANAVRLGHYPFSRHALEKVSELGLVAWAEKPSGFRTTARTCARSDPTEAYLSNAKQQLQETIRQQYNHAAIAVWSVGNETSASQSTCPDPFDNVTPYLRSMNSVAKAEDATRPTVYAEFPHPIDDRRVGPLKTEGITDLFATNRYFLWYHGSIDGLPPILDGLRALTPAQPLAVSEYGAGAALTHHTDDPRGGVIEASSAEDDAPPSYQPEEYASYVHEENYRVLSSKPYLWGTFAWNMFDFGSANRREGDVLGVNTKGLVTFDRKTRKDPFFFYKANWSSEPVTYITGRRYTDRAYAVTDVKVYSNADTVQLSLDDTPIGTMTAAQCEQRTCVFKAVSLHQGVNRLTAVGNHAGQSVSDSVEWRLDTTGVNIAAGMLRTGYVSSQGLKFGSDHFFVGGSADVVGGGHRSEGGIPSDIVGTRDPQLFKYFRSGDFSYDIPIADGDYEVTLGFLEPDAGNRPGVRVFDVIAGGNPVLQGLDVLREAGDQRTALTKSFPVTVTGGHLVLEFKPTKGDALVSNIAIDPAQ